MFPSFEHLRQLKSSRPVLELLNNLSQSGTRAAQGADCKRNMGWRRNTFQLFPFIADVSTAPSGMCFPRPAWVKLNYLQTGVGIFRSTMHKLRMAHTAACECGVKKETSEHVITYCPFYLHSNGVRTLSGVDKSLVSWLTDTCPAI